MRADAGVLFLLIATAPLGAQGADVGVVAEYRPASGRFVFERGSERVPVAIGTVVKAGDRVTLPPGAAVIVQLGTGASLTLEQTDTVPAGPALGGVTRFFRSVSALFDTEFRQSRTAASRGGEKCGPAGSPVAPLTLPLFASDARIVAGRRDLPITWIGGCAPYTVAVLRGSDTVAVRRNVEADRVRVDGVMISPGRYRIVLLDGRRNQVDGSLEAVAALPTMPSELSSDASDLGVIAQALWLAEQDDGRWRLDAFERLRPLVRAGNPLAGSVADGILWGRPNDRPQQ